MKEYNKWNEVKKDTQNDKKIRLFKHRDIFFIKMGQNIGYEQNGKGSNFVRPVVVLKKITKDMFIGIPLSTQIKPGSWFYQFEFNTKDKISKNIAIIPQIKMFSSQRLLNKIGVMPSNNFNELKEKVKNFIN
jgi:mRNA interferase MazF